MPSWVKFTADYDHRWPSGAVTEFRAGMVVNVKQEVADEAIALKVASSTTKPKDGDAGYETSGARLDTDRVRHDLRTVVTGGHGFGGLDDQRAVLPDAADPAALRSEALIEQPRVAPVPPADDAPVPTAEPSEGQIEAAAGSPIAPENG